MDQVKIGKFLQECRKEKGWTQEQLADRLNVARRTVSRWETGSNMPDLDILIELSDLYEVGRREMLDGERKSKEMDKEMEETVLKVAEYSNAQQERTTKTVRVFFILGIVSLVINQLMFVLDAGDTFWIGFIEGVTQGIALGAMILGVCYTMGWLGRMRAFKMRLLGRKDV